MKKAPIIVFITLVSSLSFGFFVIKNKEVSKSENSPLAFNEKVTKLKENNSNDITWLTFEEAYELNKKVKKNIFIDVFTDWCGWCKKMDNTTFQDAEVRDYVKENFYAVKLDAESDENITVDNTKTTPRNIAQSMSVTGYPTIVFMREDFKTITVQSGYLSAKRFLAYLKTFNENQ